eukprot:scpid53699/ scgid27590/ 
MAEKVKVGVRLDLDHELGNDHFLTWRSQLEIGFALHEVKDQSKQYLAAAANLGESASHYLWQSYPTVPTTATNPYNDLIKLFQEYFGSKQSAASRLAELFAVEQRPGETVQAFRLRVQKDMRVCNLTSTRTAEELLGVVGVHLFARGLSSASARKSVLEHDAQDLSSAAAKAQAVVLAEDCANNAPVLEVSYAAIHQRRHTTLPTSGCGYCGEKHAPGKPHCPAVHMFCAKCGRKGHFSSVCRSDFGRADRSAQTQLPNAASAQQNRTAPAVSSLRTGAASPAVQSAQTPESYETFGVQAEKTAFTLPLRQVTLDSRHTLSLRVDSASRVSIIPKSALPSGYVLSPPPCPLQPVGTQRITAVGVFDGNLSYQGRETTETIFVV